MDAMTAAMERTVERFDRSQEKVFKNFGYGETAGGLGVAREFLSELSTAYRQRISNLAAISDRAPEKAFVRIVAQLDPDVIALATLSAMLDSVYRSVLLVKAQRNISANIEGELWAAGLLARDSILHGKIMRLAKAKSSNLKQRRQEARKLASRAGYRTEKWEHREQIRAGNWLLDVALQTLPDVFTLGRLPNNGHTLCVTEGAAALAERCIEEVMCRNPVWLPTFDKPLPWTGLAAGGYGDERMRLCAPLVRVYHKASKAAVKAAIRDGSMQPHLDAVNSLQAVPWVINTKVLEVLRWCQENRVDVKGVPEHENVEVPGRYADDEWEGLDADTKRLHSFRIRQARDRNRSLSNDRLLFKADVETAERLSAGRFYEPYSCDWRGRVYALPHWNFQREDRVRALHLFADGMPIGDEGLYWLKVHVANCGDFDKISKRPFEERVRWVDANIASLLSTATNPQSDLTWTKADKPFLFLAACIELSEVLATGPTFVTRLPVSFDGSCSGLQHLCAMTRAAEGSLVNLTPQALPQDVYQTVADLAYTRISADLNGATASPEASSLARLCLDYGITRKLVKRNVMTYSYSSKKFGMADQHKEDLMVPLSYEVLEGKRAVHPFASPLDLVTRKDGTEVQKADGNAAALYLAQHIYAAIESVVSLPAQAMTMLQKMARAMAHEGKPLSWVTPSGLPWSNRYHAMTLKQIELSLRDTRVTLTMVDGNEPEIDKIAAANGVAPNLVHACDAAHLALTTNACVREGITNIVTVHDSFGCLAPQAVRFNAIIREQFVQMYRDHDVLAEALASAKRDLTVSNWKRLPELPEYGPLQLEEVLNAQFAFA